MKFKKLTAVTLIIITLLSALALTATAEEQKDKGAIPESIPTDSVNLDIEYGVYVAVKPFDGNRSFAVAPFSRFNVSEDGSRVVLTFPSDSGTAVAVFSLRKGTMELVRGFDIALSETAIPRIYGDSVTVWLKESGVLFAVDPKNKLVAIEKLVNDADTENGKPLATTAAEEFFGDGVSDRSTVGGIRFSVSDPTESPFGTLYGHLLLTDNNGSVTALYGTFDITKAGTAVTCAIAGVALLIASATVAVELIYIGKKKKPAASDVSESAEGENI